MNLVYLTIGVVLLLGTIVDLLWTTLWVEGGAGPLTFRLMAWTWRSLRRVGAQNERLLSLSGPLIFVLSFAVWIVLLWSGWTLIFAGAESALIDTLDRGSVSWFDRIYFTGYTIFRRACRSVHRGEPVNLDLHQIPKSGIHICEIMI